MKKWLCFISVKNLTIIDVIGVHVDRCEGHNSCSLTANDATFGGPDPCPNTGKYLEIIYLCVPGNVSIGV